MSLQLPLALQMKLAVALLVLVRVSGFFALTPFFGGPALPPRVKLLLAAGIAVCIAPAMWTQGESAMAAFANPATLAFAVLSELSIGLIVGVLLAVVVAAVQTAGQLIAHDVGMTIANIIDPLSNNQISVIGQLMATVAVVVFLLMDFHHHVIRLIAESFHVVPLGSFTGDKLIGPGGWFEHAARAEGSSLFVVSVQMALPVTVVLLLVTVAMAFLARAVPEINVFIIGFAVRILVGFFVIVAMFPLLERMYELLFEKVTRDCWRLLEVFARA